MFVSLKHLLELALGIVELGKLFFHSQTGPIPFFILDAEESAENEKVKFLAIRELTFQREVGG